MVISLFYTKTEADKTTTVKSKCSSPTGHRSFIEPEEMDEVIQLGTYTNL